eukprot:COSAG01_NODE_1806_length_9192_cov_11.433410_9_plen_54_part_00
MLILGGDAQVESVEAELWDEESQLWLKLPRGMVPYHGLPTIVLYLIFVNVQNL